jgi:hypothetical protein
MVIDPVQVMNNVGRAIDSAHLNIDVAKKAFYELAAQSVKTDNLDPIPLMFALARVIEDVTEAAELLAGHRERLPSVDWDAEMAKLKGIIPHG